ncbi:MAG: DUF937 domain-containing protein [Sphingomonadaceae bacterium]
MLDILNQAGGIGAIARELGVDEGTAQAGAAALLPAILGGFKGQAQAQPEGLGGLINMIGGMGGGGLLASVLAPAPSNVDAGNSVLGQIFGSKDVSRTVAADAATKTGISGDLLKRMLPLIAMAVAGYMANQAQGGQAAPAAQDGGLGGMLGSVLGGIMGGGQQANAPASGLGGLGALLDMDRDGNPLNDLIGMAGRFAAR